MVTNQAIVRVGWYKSQTCCNSSVSNIRGKYNYLDVHQSEQLQLASRL